METNFEEMVTPAFIREVFDGHLVNRGQERWAITVCGKIVTLSGKMLFDSKQQATKAFYNGFHWRFGHNVARHINGGDGWIGEYHWWSDADRANRWKAFKKVLERDYGFKIIQV